ncbi:MAG: acylphosphatase [Candidatus Methanoperedens nitroreducens]|uniref:Acylphosphatase n=1 Tax=Candidatus Methanoperedens nitratireducens TaxID=1392998 RepID=A0A0P8ACI3_9EURY|nr:acylphosphatase [Candidatus Methanoperedens sp. BLZ2]KAB2943761.1 MAG: acylphosphatase [Candidatus Methanoperedens sp.]KPQ41799.1 MAG: acylphosphatase [Candidatus Methanoperedens sp. BLZ1]MBZ0174686.1 acylphosphatase [Candidatus Methanoperedens nitroreducens]MCX9078382.1 acylphosphatase [Candidatus Methanoperedens sp.]
MNIRVHVFISGKVQGVFFRSSTKDMAKNLDLFGWVRNLADGRVEAVFEGKKDTIEKMLEWCRVGPEYARVTGIEVIWEEFKGDFKEFLLRR